MKMLWKSDLGQGKHDPLEIVAVETKSGSRISADLVVAMDPVEGLRVDAQQVGVAASEVTGLLEVIEAQMVAIDELSTKVGRLENGYEPNQNKELARLQEWADQFPEMIEDLCIALGFARNPVGPTGIPELDIIVSLAR